jgi:hypothetical protein
LTSWKEECRWVDMFIEHLETMVTWLQSPPYGPLPSIKFEVGRLTFTLNGVRVNMFLIFSCPRWKKSGGQVGGGGWRGWRKVN